LVFFNFLIKILKNLQFQFFVGNSFRKIKELAFLVISKAQITCNSHERTRRKTAGFLGSSLVIFVSFEKWQL